MLTGLRIIECGAMVSAAYATKLMADLGAEVIKIEPPVSGDVARARGPFADPRGDPEASGLFLYLNANKLGLSLNLHHPRGRAMLLALLQAADALVHNFPPVLCKELDLTYESLSCGNPGLVVTHISTFGAYGPHSDYRGGDLISLAAGGWAYLTPGGANDPTLPPLRAFGQQAEFQGGVHAAIATMGALFARRTTGRGQLLDVSIQECIAAALELALVRYTYRGEVARRYGAWLPVMRIMRCKDGPIFVMILEDEHWHRLVQLMGNPEWGSWEIFRDRESRAANLDVLQSYVEGWLTNHTVADVFRMAGEARLPFAPVSTIADVLELEHLRARSFFQSITHPVAGALTYPGAPYKLTDGAWRLRRPAPLLGQHNEEVYARIGVGCEELGRLRASGVI
jgi:crotonobetainyl-CoA:carnitine CoA-transferase CaiB-like acyl-CoA transferase